MNRKGKGINAERELIHFFWEKGWAAIRVAGSGATKYPSVDIVAGTPLRKLAIECKAINDTKKYFRKEEIDQLRQFSSKFGAEAWIAIRFNRVKWHFLSIEDLRETPEGAMVSQELATLKGLLFEEVIK